MDTDNQNRHRYMGTYFKPESFIRISNISRVLAWIILGIYSVDFLVAVFVIILQIARGFWASLGFTDYATNILIALERPVRGLVSFILLLGLAEIMKAVMDIEDNTRRSARISSK